MSSMEFLIKAGIETHQSLLISIAEAGGSPSSFTVKDLENMTAMELISQLATNGIRFVHTRTQKSYEEEVSDIEELIRRR